MHNCRLVEKQALGIGWFAGGGGWVWMGVN